MNDSSGRPYYLFALIVGLLLLAWGGVAVVRAFSRIVPSNRTELPVEASPRQAPAGPASGSNPTRDVHAVLDLLSPVEAACSESVAQLRQGPGGAASIPGFEAKWQETRARLDATLPAEQSAGHLSPADVQDVNRAMDAYRQASLRLRDYASSGQSSWLDQAEAQAKLAKEAREALAR